MQIANKNDMDYDLIETYKIAIDTSYQRGVNKLKVKKIINNFNSNAFGSLLVSKRDGDDNYYLIDGQHRLNAANIKSMKIVPCCIIYGLTQQEEAELFIELNSNRYQVKSMDKFKAKVAAKNKNTLEIIDIMNKYGFKPNLMNSGCISTRRKGYITNFSVVENIYNSKGNKFLDYVLRIIKAIWGYNDGTFDADALRKDTIEGIYTFLAKYSKDIDEKKFIEKMRKIEAIKLIHEQNKNQSIYGKGKPYNYVKAVIEAYNYRAIRKIEFKN
jgi:hypothetical protein